MNTLFHVLSCAKVTPLLDAMASHVSPDLTRWKRSQLAATPGMVGELLGAAEVVVVVVAEDLDLEVAVDVAVLDAEGEVDVSGVQLPSTQYGLPASRLGQTTPGLSFAKSATEMPQLAPRLAHVSPLSAAISKEQVTPRCTWTCTLPYLRLSGVMTLAANAICGLDSTQH